MRKENLHATFGASVEFDSAVFVAFGSHFDITVWAEARLIGHNYQTLTGALAI